MSREPWLAEIWDWIKADSSGLLAVQDDGLCRGRAARLKGMAVPLAVKELRPLRGAFGVLDSEPPARQRQNGGAGQEPASARRRAALKSAGPLGPIRDHATG